MDTRQAFQLIDRVLPFEACLYHQILPLSLEENCLHLGMVTLEDVAALDYVRRLLAFMRYSLVPQSISSEAHYATLSAYLSHTGKQKMPTASDAAPQALRLTNATAQSSDQHSKATFLVDAPDELEVPHLPIARMHTKASTVQEPPPNSLPSAEPPSDPQLSPPNSAPDLEPPSSSSEPLPSQELPTPGDALPTLVLTAEHLDSPLEALATLPPAQLLQELLGRILTGGIGRLYFERRAESGRILWSQNGVLQSVLNDLPLDIFQSLITELKLLTHLPLPTVQQPKQVEIERIYQKSRLLLRLRVMLNTHGEEATLQILRGAALRFYQQQQLANLSRDALTIAQELQKKISEIHDRTRLGSQPDLNRSTIVPDLSRVLQHIEQQLEALKQIQKRSEELE